MYAIMTGVGYIDNENIIVHGPLTRYVKLQIAYAPGMPGTFSHATAS